MAAPSCVSESSMDGMGLQAILARARQKTKPQMPPIPVHNLNKVNMSSDRRLRQRSFVRISILFSRRTSHRKRAGQNPGQVLRIGIHWRPIFTYCAVKPFQRVLGGRINVETRPVRGLDGGQLRSMPRRTGLSALRPTPKKWNKFRAPTNGRENGINPSNR